MHTPVFFWLYQPVFSDAAKYTIPTICILIFFLKPLVMKNTVLVKIAVGLVTFEILSVIIIELVRYDIPDGWNFAPWANYVLLCLLCYYFKAVKKFNISLAAFILMVLPGLLGYLFSFFIGRIPINLGPAGFGILSMTLLFLPWIGEVIIGIQLLRGNRHSLLSRPIKALGWIFAIEPPIIAIGTALYTFFVDIPWVFYFFSIITILKFIAMGWVIIDELRLAENSTLIAPEETPADV
jgi:hypothetical protein